VGGATGVVTRRPPRLLVLTDRTQTAGRPLLDVVTAAIAGGARAVVLREKDLAARARAELASALAAVLRPVDGMLLVASGPATADGVHLAGADPFPVPAPPVVGRSCHSGAELRDAAVEGCAYATLSPIFRSASKPGYGPPLGPEALRDAPLPVLALGGVTPSNAGACVAAGAYGVAVMGELMRAPDPAATVSALLEAVDVAAVAR
jgi:thiamine-phosphate diphosphorylase